MFLRVIHTCCFEWRELRVERAIKLDAIAVEALQIFGFIVGLPVLPTTPQDSQPLEGYHPNGRPAAFAFAQLVLIEQPSPVALTNRTLGKLDDALMHKDWTSIAEMHDPEAAAFFFNGGHTTKAQQLVGRLEIGPDRAHGRCQPGRQGWTAAGQ